MIVYLVRHGEAGRAFVDAERPLTEAGREDVARVAARATERGVAIPEIRHSGRRRARETAEILSEALRPPAGIVEVAGLHPSDDPESIALSLDAEPDPLMLVGHLPFMGCLAGLLVTGDAERAPVPFAPATMACLQLDDPGERWRVAWVISPR